MNDEAKNELSVMDREAFRRKEAWRRLQSELAVADQQMTAGRMADHDEVMRSLKARLDSRFSN